MLVPAELATVVARCAPFVGRLTMTSIVAYESGARPLAIHDNTARRSYFPAWREAAVRLATALDRQGHDFDVGYAQLNVATLRAYGLGFDDAFEPCRNVRVASRVLRADYARAVVAYGPGQIALAHAISAYNSGGFATGLAYARAIYATAARLHASAAP